MVSLDKLDMLICKDAFLKVARSKEHVWKLSTRADDWSTDKAREMRNMLRHVGQAILR